MFSLKSRIFACLFIIIFTFTIIIGYLSGVVMPILYSKSEAYIKTYIEKYVAKAIVNFNDSDIFQNPITFEYDNTGKITAYTANALVTSKFRALISKNIIDSIDSERDIGFNIKAGTLSGIPFLYGQGPEIKINLTGMTFVTFDTVSEFTDSGINQTLHKITLYIEAKCYIKEPLGKRSIVTKTSLPISETVLIGDVPEAYTVIHRAYEDDEEDINDYGAQID
ncbi:MAG: hypothetical protein E7635_07380 [Ruminococcaceae bacterium]|nr:hypothetical protein [Oscillospiraceae bacterium]